MLLPNSRLRLAMVAVLVAGFAAIGGWIAFNGNPDTISGGLTFLPPGINAVLGRLAFGIGSLVSIAILFVVLMIYWSRTPDVFWVNHTVDNDRIVVGGRGFARARLRVPGFRWRTPAWKSPERRETRRYATS